MTRSTFGVAWNNILGTSTAVEARPRLAIAIPTYNRPLILQQNLTAMLPDLRSNRSTCLHIRRQHGAGNGSGHTQDGGS